MVTVQVFSKSSGSAVSGKKVTVHFGDWFGGQLSGFTDSRGEVHFDAKPQQGTVYVDGQKRFEGRIEGRVIVYI